MINKKQEFLSATAQLDRFLELLFSTIRTQHFKRVNYYYINGETQLLRSYPGEKIQNPNLYLNQSNTPYGKKFI